MRKIKGKRSDPETETATDKEIETETDTETEIPNAVRKPEGDSSQVPCLAIGQESRIDP